MLCVTILQYVAPIYFSFFKYFIGNFFFKLQE